MCYWLLPESGVPIARTSIQAISKDELNTDSIKTKLKQYDEKIEEKLIHLTTNTPHNPAIYTFYQEDEDPNEVEDAPMETIPTIKEEDELLSTEPILNTKEGNVRIKITGWKQDKDGSLVGQHHHNPILSTRIYLEQLPDGSISEYAVNIITGEIYKQAIIKDMRIVFSQLYLVTSLMKWIYMKMIDQDLQIYYHKLIFYRVLIRYLFEILKDGNVEWVDGTLSWYPMSEINTKY